MTENKNVETILKNGDKALSGMPYLYRSKGLPSEVYDVRMREDINGELLKLAIADTVIRYPYFKFGMSFVFVSDYDRMSAYCIPVKGKNGEAYS